MTGMGVRVQYPPSKILKLEGFVSKALLLVHPSSSGPVAQLYLSNRAGHWASLLPSLCPWNHGILPAGPDLGGCPGLEALEKLCPPPESQVWTTDGSHVHVHLPYSPPIINWAFFFSDYKCSTVLLLKKERKERII